jgi:multiple sugar transport system permease protein
MAVAARRRGRPFRAPKVFSGRAWRETRSFYLFIAPWLIGFVALSLVPLALGFATSLTNYDGFNLDNLKFRGFANYERILEDDDVVYSLGRTLLYTAINVPLGIALALGLAMLLNQAIAGRGVFRTLFYLPHVVPIVAVVWIWRIFLDQNFGILNAMISIFRPDTGIRWLVDYPTEVVVALSLWTGVGGGMVIFLAGLQGIPTELKEAARIDGANAWDVFRHVTLPLLTPVVFFQMILSIIGSLQVLVAPMLLTGTQLGSLPPRDNYFYVVHVFQQVFANQRFGYGTALLWLLFLVIVVLSVLVFRSSRYWVYYEVEQEGPKA